MCFKDGFIQWLTDASLDLPSENIPPAFSFNLSEPAFVNGVKFSIEIIGASYFDASDEDWACDEIWQPKNRTLNIPITFSGENWEKCLSIMADMIQNLIDNNDSCIRNFKYSKGIGIGFVDGNLQLLKI